MQYVKAMQYAFGILLFFFFYPQYIITGNINISMSVCMPTCLWTAFHCVR